MRGPGEARAGARRARTGAGPWIRAEPEGAPPRAGGARTRAYLAGAGVPGAGEGAPPAVQGRQLRVFASRGGGGVAGGNVWFPWCLVTLPSAVTLSHSLPGLGGRISCVGGGEGEVGASELTVGLSGSLSSTCDGA